MAELLRAPHVTPGEIDAFLEALAEPAPEGESSRLREELLRSFIQDRQLSALRGSDGQTVKAAATQAVLELRRSRGLAMPVDLMPPPPPVKQEPPREPGHVWSSAWGWVGMLLIVGVNVWQLPLVESLQRRGGELGPPFWKVPHVVATSLLPALVMVLGDVFSSRKLYGLGLIWLLLSGVFSVLLALYRGPGDLTLGGILLVSGVVSLVAGKLMDTAK